VSGIGLAPTPVSRRAHEVLEPVLTPEERRDLAWRLGGVLAAGALLLAGLAHRALGGPPEVSGLILGAGALVAAGPVLAAGVRGFWRGDPNAMVDQLVSVALLAALAGGEFETAILIPLLLALGHFLEERSVLGARAAIEGLKQLRTTTAARLTGEGEVTVPVEDLTPGDRIAIRPGEAVPADGRVLRGASAVDQSPMTGEAVPEEVIPGSPVFAGTVNLSGVLEVEVTAVAEATALGRIVSLLREAERAKAPIVQVIERHAHYYLPGMLALAAAVLAYTQELGRAVAILVVSCPCALVLASPSAMTAALAVAARLGVLVKSARFLEALGDVDTLVLDKTGTVTIGRLEVVGVHDLAGLGEDGVLTEAATCAAGSRHPVSRAIVAAAGTGKVKDLALSEEVPGRGVLRRDDGSLLRLGSAAWLREVGIEVPAEPEHTGPLVWLARDRDVLGVVLLADRPRRESGEAVAALRRLGVSRAILLTGDRPETASDVGRELGLDAVFARCLPETKLAIVEREKATDGRTVMVVGDGVNDALALRRADVGVAMGAMGSAVAVSSADIALMSNDLRRLADTMRLARATRRTIHENVGLALGSTLLMLALAAAGLLGPIAAAVVQNLGSVLVVLNSGRLLRFAPAGDAGLTADGRSR
jgi:Cd2+/Zn2+-exporting ATPase/Cu+-exporting ATPase